MACFVVVLNMNFGSTRNRGLIWLRVVMLLMKNMMYIQIDQIKDRAYVG